MENWEKSPVFAATTYIFRLSNHLKQILIFAQTKESYMAYGQNVMLMLLAITMVTGCFPSPQALARRRKCIPFF